MRWLAALLLGMSLASGAAEPRKYAIISIVGDKLLVVQRDLATGTNVDRNVRQFLDLNNPAFDNATLFAVEDAVKAADPGAGTVLLGVRDPAIYAIQAKGLEGDGAVATVYPALQDAVASTKATHVILVSKHRAPARLQLADSTQGTGTLEGLGFYIDRFAPVQSRTTGARTTGYLAPFAYFRVSLIDAATGRLAREEAVTASHVTMNQDAVTAWEGLTAENKVRFIERLIREEVKRVVPALLAN